MSMRLPHDLSIGFAPPFLWILSQIIYVHLFLNIVVDVGFYRLTSRMCLLHGRLLDLISIEWT